MRDKILIVSSAHHAADTRITYRQARSLSAKFDITLIAQHPLSDSLPENIRYYFVPINKSLLYRVLYAGILMIQQLFKDDIRSVILHDPELVPYAIVLNSFGIKVIVDHHEDYYALLKRKRTSRFSKQILNILLKLNENILQNHVELNVVATPGIKSALDQLELPTFLFPNYAGRLDLKAPIKPKKVVDAPIDLIYIGYGSEQRGLIAILDLLDFVNHEYNIELNCHIAGLIRPSDEYKKAVSHSAWNLVTYHGFVNRNTLADLLSDSKIGLCPYLEDDHHKEALPNKIFEYAFLGCAIVGQNLQQWKFINNMEIGILTDFTNTKEAADHILSLMQNELKLNTFRDNAYRESRHEFSYERLEKTFIKQVESIFR